MTADPPSAVPAVIDRLVVLAREHLDEDRTVYDATSAAGDEGDSNMHALFIGLDDPDDETGNAAETESDFRSTGGRNSTETGTVTCIARSISADGDPAAARAAAYVTLTGLRDAVAADRTLGLPYLAWARLPASTRLVYLEDSNSGVMAELTFTVFINAYLTS